MTLSSQEKIDTIPIMKRFLLFITALIVIFTVFFYIKHPLGAKVRIGNNVIPVEVAVTNTEKEKGLGDRDSLAPSSGMLFVYDHKEPYVYWMKGMRFPLDFIWLDGNIVVDLTANVPSPTTASEEPVRVHPQVAVDKVLEVNAGVIQKLGIKTGDTVFFTN